MQSSQTEARNGAAAAGRPVVAAMREVSKAFGEVVALRSIDLDIAAGEIVGIIGPSGSGKTTAIRLLLGIYAPTSGVVEVLGDDPAHFSRADRERIGYLPQFFVLYPDLTVYENLAFIAGTYGLGWIRRRRRINQLLDLLHLTDAKDRLAENISGGMQRRLELGAALINDPDLVILDEPTAGLDPVLRAEVWNTFREMQQHGRTLVVTTQYVTEAEYCDRVEVIDRGRIISSGTPEELRRLANGGDLVRLTIPDLDRATVRAIDAYPFVKRTEWSGGDVVQLVVDQASQAIPALTERLHQDGFQFASIEENREPFDQIFVRLVDRAADGQAVDR
ncbi:MAG TPA: ABC transporter ATP-binding protein [Thermomicrobiaceae bacterium]|nr:ABC transporter ATP-binding protein [Thermomicrobiaceae bacterium]